MKDGSDPSQLRRPRRRYPLRAYLPFALMVAIPLLLIIAVIMAISHLSAPTAKAPGVTSTATSLPLGATTTSTAQGKGALPPQTQVVSGSTPLRTATPTLRPITFALTHTADMKPVSPTTTFPHKTNEVWAFALVPNVHTGDSIRFRWLDLENKVVVNDYTGHAGASAALYPVHAFAFPGTGTVATIAFTPGTYELTIYHNDVVVAAGRFTIAATS